MTTADTGSYATDSQVEGKRVVLIVSTMRAGSTLLKALLAEANDVSNLPEVNFQRFQNEGTAWRQIGDLDDHRVIVLKRPAWYHEVFSYPRLPPVANLKIIVLARNAYDTVASLRKMTFGRWNRLAAPLANRLLVEQYWARVNERLAELLRMQGANARLVRYESLTADPVATTSGLFEFIGSRQRRGVERYTAPRQFKWKWGQDDGGQKIRSLRVQSTTTARDDESLLNAIERSSRAQRAIDLLREFEGNAGPA